MNVNLLTNTTGIPLKVPGASGFEFKFPLMA